MGAILIGALISAAAVSTSADAQLEQIAAKINAPHAHGSVDLQHAVIVGNTLTADIVSTDPVAMTSDATAGQVRQIVCRMPALRTLMATPSVELRFNVIAPDLAKPLSVPVRAADCSSAATGGGNSSVTAGPEVTTSVPTSPQTSASFDFKGVPLGITYDEFRRLPHPDGKESQVVCTGDKVIIYRTPSEPVEVAIYDPIERAIGIRNCIWLATGGYDAGRSARLSLAGTGYGTLLYTFSFIPDPNDGVLRLYRFQAVAKNVVEDAVTQALTAKFGQPKISTGTIQNGVGNNLDQRTYRWVNGKGALSIQSPALSIDELTIVMTDNRLSQFEEDQKATKRSAVPDGI